MSRTWSRIAAALQATAAVLAAALLVVVTTATSGLAATGNDTAATATRVRVRAVAHGALIIGDAVGGARITIREQASGLVLAEGFQHGGDSGTGAAAYEATVYLSRPTVVEISALGPLDRPQASMRASKTLLLLPGQDLLGAGITLEIHGFIVNIQSPAWEPGLGQGHLPRGEDLNVRAAVRRPCGSLALASGQAGGHIELRAQLWRGSTLLVETSMTSTVPAGTYTGTLPLHSAGGAELLVLAGDPATGNFGMASLPLVVVEPAAPAPAPTGRR